MRGETCRQGKGVLTMLIDEDYVYKKKCNLLKSFCTEVNEGAHKCSCKSCRRGLINSLYHEDAIYWLTMLGAVGLVMT